LDQIRLFPIEYSFQEIIPLPASKSESNRSLILNALAGGELSYLSNLAEARDTQTMIRLLSQKDQEVADVLDAGTTMRFLTAYYAITGQKKRMTGTPRMCERPIGILVDALKTLGADIEYENQLGYPPLLLRGFSYAGTRSLSMRGDVSSQFISAILMLAPLLPEGLHVKITGSLGSKPYIEMTLAQMKHFGIESKVDWEKGEIDIAHQSYNSIPFAVESDWSGASYWYSMVAISPFEDTSLELLGLKENSLQGDSEIKSIMELLGVKSTFTGRGYLLTKCPSKESAESLKVKETDRVLALQNELAKLGSQLVELEKNHLYQLSGDFANRDTCPEIETYDDHRMAMAFAPVGLLCELIIHEPGVVAKSYPSFWDHIHKILKSA